MIYSYIITSILTHRWNPNRYHHTGTEWTCLAIPMKRRSTLSRSPKLDPHNLLQLCYTKEPPAEDIIIVF